MAQSKKIRLLTTGVATILAAAALIGGGTLSYLKSETEDVVNEFNPNQVTVDLAETTDNDYEIIPGTTAEKDPKVTVNNTVDSYVYVVVTDNTDELVDYKIAEGWEPLDGYKGVYYREVAADDEVKEFYVLEGNKVSYDATLENTHMVDEDGILKEGLALTFKAYAIQQAGFESAKDAYDKELTCCITTGEKLQQAINDCEPGGTVKLCMDITTDIPIVITDKSMTLDLNGYTLDAGGVSIGNYASNTDIAVKVKGGTVKGGSADYWFMPIDVYSDGANYEVDFTLENVTVESDDDIEAAVKSNGHGIAMTLKNCNVTGMVQATDSHLVIESGRYTARENDRCGVYANFGAEIHGGTFTAVAAEQYIFEVGGYDYDFVIHNGEFNTENYYTIVSVSGGTLSNYVKIEGGTFNDTPYTPEMYDDVAIKKGEL